METEGRSSSNGESEEKSTLLNNVKNKRTLPSVIRESSEKKSEEQDLISFFEERCPTIVSKNSAKEVATNGTTQADARKLAAPFGVSRKIAVPFGVPRKMAAPFGVSRKIVPIFETEASTDQHPKEKKVNNQRRSAPVGCCTVDQSAYQLDAACNVSPKWLSSTKKYIDSHCHLDFIYNKIGQNGEGINDWMLKYPKAFPSNFHGCIPNFVHPSLFVCPDSESKDYDPDWIYKQVKHEKVLGASYGIHPHYCAGYNDKMKDAISNMFNTKDQSKAVAVGECGYDLYRSETSVEQQQVAFESQLEIAVKHGVPVIVHCRSSKGTTDAEDLCLTSMLKILPRFHHIHRHCFTESYHTARMWLRNFPNTHFGFTCVIEKPFVDLSAVRSLPLRNILLETDAPYFNPSSFQSKGPRYTSLPGMAVAGVDVIAKERNISVDEVIDATYLNTLHVYDLNKY